mmetsp:Transcript_114667/g.272761  ORF Transcript_114667/g.272761 Transcript_114667/m.272761 type:complete len:280 (-) Transcript_114667:239-1078(-)
MNSRSWVTITKGRSCCFRNSSIHSTAFRSKWLVGSSRRITSGLIMKSLDMPILTFQPPLKRPTLRSMSSERKPTCFMTKAKVCSSLSTPSRSFWSLSSCNLSTKVCISSGSSGFASRAFSTSSISSITAFCCGTALRISCRKVFSRFRSSTKLCSKIAILAFGGLFTTCPCSGVSCPSSTRSCVVLPQPLAPTSASFSPVRTVQEASWRIIRPPRRTATSLMPTVILPSTSPLWRKLKSTWSSAPLLRLTGSSSSSSSSSSESGAYSSFQSSRSANFSR